jgi:integrase
MSIPLIIAIEDRQQGLRVWCDKCRCEVSKICKSTRQPLSTCTNADKHKFKVFATDPESGKKKTKTLATRNLNQAKLEATGFIDEVENGVKRLPVQQTKGKPELPQLLIEGISKYLAFKEDIGVPFHKRRKLEDKYLGEIKGAFTFLLQSLHKHQHDPNTFTLEDFLDDFIVGEICEELENSPAFGKRTYNKRLQFYTSFEYWLSKTFKLSYQGLFEDVPRKKGKKEPEAITEDEFDRLLDIITPENGIRVVNYRSKKRENHYYPWLEVGFRIALETGGRRPGIVYLQFNNIQEKNGLPNIIKMEDVKHNNQFKLTGDDKKYLYIPISEGMLQLLIELGYDHHKGTDHYLLAPEILKNRHTMLDKLTRAFTYYYSQLDTGRHLTLYSCRRANITEEYLNRAPGVAPIHHSSDKIEKASYIAPKVVAAAKSGRKVFSLTKKT